jgi:hypothetical protein
MDAWAKPTLNRAKNPTSFYEDGTKACAATIGKGRTAFAMAVRFWVASGRAWRLREDEKEDLIA